jgi:hypothetical protein
MNKKLTLSLDEYVIQKAKIYAENTGNSLSGLVEDYFERLIQPTQKEASPSRLNAISGKINLPENFDEDQELRKALEKKHLR